MVRESANAGSSMRQPGRGLPMRSGSAGPRKKEAQPESNSGLSSANRSTGTGFDRVYTPG